MLFLPLDQFTVPEINPSNIEDLVESIDEHGLIDNIRVMKIDGNIEIIDGGLRIAALKTLQQSGRLPGDYMVPCEIVAIN